MRQAGPMGANCLRYSRVASPDETTAEKPSSITPRLANCSVRLSFGRGELEINMTGPCSALNRFKAT